MTAKKSPRAVKPAMTPHQSRHADLSIAPADQHPQSPQLAPERPTAREILRLQRTLGNQLVGRQLRQLVQRTLTRGDGWGWPTWTGGAAGQKLWQDIDKNFNTKLPSLKSELATLKENNKFFTAELQVVVAAIGQIELDYTAPIPYSGAQALHARLTGVIKQYDDAVIELGKQKAILVTQATVEIDKLLARVNLLPGLKVSQVAPPDHVARRDVKQVLDDLKAEQRPFSAGELALLTKKVVAVEKSFNDSVAVALKAKQDKEDAELAQQKQELLDKAEAARLEKLRVAIKAKVDNQYGALLGKCGNDVDVLFSLMPFISKGQGGLLHNCLNYATPAELLQLFGVRSIPVATLNQMLVLLGDGRAASLLTLLQAISSGEEAKLLSVLTTTKGDPIDHLKTLITKTDISTLQTLLNQGTTAQLTALLVTKNLSVADIKTLLASTSAADTVFVLEKVPDTKFLLQLQPLAASPEEFRALVSDLPLNLPSIQSIKTLLKRKNTVTTMAEITAEATVKKARGLLTNAGATIAEGTVSGLAGTDESASVQATLDGIASGEFPTLTHNAGAKFGDPWNNDAGRLPGVRGAGGYKEYYVEKDPASGSFHGERRLVVNDKTNHIYYSADHYGSFIRIQ